MIERLGGQHTGGAARALDQGDAARGLHEAVESAAVRLGPRRQRQHDDAGPTLGKLLGCEAESGESIGAVSECHDVGRGEKLVEPRGARGRGQVEQCRELAVTGVEMLAGDLGQRRRVEAQHFRTEQRERTRRDGAGDDAGQIEHAHTAQRCGCLGIRPRSAGCFADARDLDQGSAAQSGIRGGIFWPHRHAEPADGVDRGDSRGSGQCRECLCHTGGVSIPGQTQSAQQPVAMMRVVRMRAHRTVERGEEARQRSEGPLRLPIDAHPSLARVRDGDAVRIELRGAGDVGDRHRRRRGCADGHRGEPRDIRAGGEGDRRCHGTHATPGPA